MASCKRASRCVFAALVFLASQSAAAEWLAGRVVGVADGDTVMVLDTAHARHKVRLAGIDAPEKSQPFGQVSKQSLSELAYGRAVTVDWQKRDRYRRIVGRLFEGGREVNLEQIRRGLAWHYKRYAREQDALDRERYAAAEREARTARRGLWGATKPIPPWEWRRARRGATMGERAGGVFSSVPPPKTGRRAVRAPPARHDN